MRKKPRIMTPGRCSLVLEEEVQQRQPAWHRAEPAPGMPTDPSSVPCPWSKLETETLSTISVICLG